eukprot:TRINITY_DN11152_c0_g1_i1.p1 TRINITY_DN11152_c0_g1~~TRINITY_DN11152_c0_g1_i1.p1  ORF type:complete len:311 (+),score=75.29 TRINITY_DN11152_c0_g1_i1:51-935(+)
MQKGTGKGKNWWASWDQKDVQKSAAEAARQQKAVELKAKLEDHRNGLATLKCKLAQSVLLRALGTGSVAAAERARRAYQAVLKLLRCVQKPEVRVHRKHLSVLVKVASETGDDGRGALEVLAAQLSSSLDLEVLVPRSELKRLMLVVANVLTSQFTANSAKCVSQAGAERSGLKRQAQDDISSRRQAPRQQRDEQLEAETASGKDVEPRQQRDEQPEAETASGKDVELVDGTGEPAVDATDTTEFIAGSEELEVDFDADSVDSDTGELHSGAAGAKDVEADSSKQGPTLVSAGV